MVIAKELSAMLNLRKEKMKNPITVAIVLGLYATSHSAYAWEEQLIRPACIPASNYFRIDHLTVDGMTLYNNTEHTKKGRRIEQAWRKAGIYRPDNLVYTCVLPVATYRLVAARGAYKQSGRCAESPTITITLHRNGKPTLVGIPFGDDCHGGYPVTGVVIKDGERGLSASQVTLCFSNPTGLDTICPEVKHLPMDSSESYDLGEQMFK